MLQNGATFADGKVGQAFSFDGVDAFVEVPDNALWTFGDDPFTIDLWVNFREVPNRAPFVDHNEGPFNTNKWVFWFDNIGHGIAGPALRFHINSPSLGPLDPVIAPWSPNTGQWYHVAVTRNGSTYTLYIDGVQVATNIDTHTIPDANVPLSIGQSEHQYFFNGLIDEVEIYRRALTASEIQAIFNAGSAGKCKEPDNDGDGVPNDEDACPKSDRSTTVVIDGCDSEVTNTVFPSGCTLADLLDDCADKARKHHKFVHCVARLTSTMKRIGIITGQQKDTIQSCAAQADLP
jgi:hypothetical protein